jgi:hypothetical protein
MKHGRVAMGAGIALGISLVAPTGAGAATVTLGSPLTSEFTNNPAGSVATNAMVDGPNIASPVDGTVLNWRTQGFVGTFRVRVLKLGAGHAATAVASASSVTLNGGTVDSPVNVPIHKGEIVGFDNTSGTDMADVADDSPDYLSAFWATLPDNGSPQLPGPMGDNAPLEFAYNATVRYCLVPSLIGQNLSAVGDALTGAACQLGSVTKKKVKKNKKGKKKKPKLFVRSQSAAAGTSLADGATVDVSLAPKKAKKHKKKH